MKTRMAVFVHQPRCSVQSVNGIMNALSEEYTFKIFTKHFGLFFKICKIVVITHPIDNNLAKESTENV